MSSASSSSSSSAPHMSPVLGPRSHQHQYQESDEELELKLRVREMQKIQEARKRMMSGGGGGGGSSRSSGVYKNERSSRMNACDLNGEEFQIVCEELWIDFKKLVNHHKNLSDCIGKVREAVVSFWRPIWLLLGFLILFRWYIGAGKDACSYGVGYGVFSFTCEVLRHLGEFVAAILIMIVGFCVGILPMLVCVCFYEFNDTFPDPDADDTDDEADAKHLKKE